jgi:signal transduction histidine kinase
VTDKALRDVVAEVAALRDGDLVLLLSMQTDGEGVARTGPEIVAALRRVATVPIYSMSRVFLGRGIVGGVLVDMERHGLDLTARARQILSGDRAADLPAMVSANQMAFDWGELKRFGIDEARLPPGATVVNRQLGLWETYRRTVLVVGAVLLGQGFLIGMLWLQSRRLQESEHRYRVTAERNQRLAGRLISAQEEERTRIARELHDDISQQLAILQMDLHQLAGSVQGPAETIASEATQSAENIATSVRNLSHELYPASLRLIGLVSALKGLVAELSERRLRITFTHDAVPAKLPPDLSLCVFRIVQEALQNALKHSHANSVSVDLRCEDERLAVTVTDDGVGFVVEGLGQQGFGLIGMGERVEAIGGRFTLWSSPHRGTTLHATLPMLPIDRSIASAV